MAARTFSLAPGAAIQICSMTQRSSTLRSACVVVGACRSAGMFQARPSMAVRSARLSRLGGTG
jgi:hypothetical protein